MLLKISVVIFGIFLIFTNTHTQDNMFDLEMTDGYFQTSSHQPVHLIDGEVSRQQIWLGDGVRLWYTLKLRDGLDGPCGRKSKDPCTTLLSFVSEAPKGSWNLKDTARIEGELSINFGIPLDREKTPLGNASFVFKVEKDGKVLFTHQVPVEIK